MDRWLKDAFFHESVLPEFLGRRMRPLCARHLLALAALECGLVTRREDRGEAGLRGLEDLIMGLLVCGCGTEEELQAVVAGAPEPTERGWIMGVELAQDAALAERVEREFRLYFDDYFQCAELGQRPVQPGQRGKWQCHWLTILVAALVRGGYSPGEAWWLPIGEALAMKLALFEVEGRDFLLMTDKEKQEWRELGWEV